MGTVKYLLASHFNKFGELSNFKNTYLNSSDYDRENLLKENDLILAGKGLRFFAWAYQKKEGDCIASSLFYVIRPHKMLLGEYLAFYLNRTPVQHQLKLLASGAATPSLAKKELQNLSIEIPSLKAQKEMVTFSRLMQKEQQLYEQLIRRKKQIQNELLNQKFKQLKKLSHV